MARCQHLRAQVTGFELTHAELIADCMKKVGDYLSFTFTQSCDGSHGPLMVVGKQYVAQVENDGFHGLFSSFLNRFLCWLCCMAAVYHAMKPNRQTSSTLPESDGSCMIWRI
jgi:hypothetical protein